MATPVAAFSVSTAAVPPQNRMFDSDIEEYVILKGTGLVNESLNWFPGRKIRITSLRMANGLVAQAASTNTTVFDIDSEDGAGAKVNDIATKAASVVAADVVVSLTLSTTEADLVIGATEMLKCLVTIAGTQGQFTISVGFKRLDVIDTPGAWPATP